MIARVRSWWYWFTQGMQQQDSSIELVRRGRLRVWIFRPYMAPRWCGVLQVQWGRGAGYIGGWTAFAALNMRNRYPWGSPRSRRRLLQLGATRQGNVIPCSY